MTRDLRGTLSRGPELFQLCQFSSIPAHGGYFSASCDAQVSLLFVRLAHDRRFGLLFIHSKKARSRVKENECPWHTALSS